MFMGDVMTLSLVPIKEVNEQVSLMGDYLTIALEPIREVDEPEDSGCLSAPPVPTPYYTPLEGPADAPFFSLPLPTAASSSGTGSDDSMPGTPRLASIAAFPGLVDFCLQSGSKTLALMRELEMDEGKGVERAGLGLDDASLAEEELHTIIHGPYSNPGLGLGIRF